MELSKLNDPSFSGMSWGSTDGGYFHYLYSAFRTVYYAGMLCGWWSWCRKVNIIRADHPRDPCCDIWTVFIYLVFQIKRKGDSETVLSLLLECLLQYKYIIILRRSLGFWRQKLAVLWPVTTHKALYHSIVCQLYESTELHSQVRVPFQYNDRLFRCEDTHYNLTRLKVRKQVKAGCLWMESIDRQWIPFINALRWRHNEPDGVSNHQPRDCLLNCLFRFRSKKTSKLRVTGLCAENSPGTGEFSAQKASNAENVFIWWRHHGHHAPIHVET